MPPPAVKPEAMGAPGALGPTSTVDLGSMTPRQAADRLFARVMTSLESGDTAQATLFLPMAIASYDRIVALSLDDRFHLSLLHAAAADGASARGRRPEAGLAVRPTHLLCLARCGAGGADGRRRGQGPRALSHARRRLRGRKWPPGCRSTAPRRGTPTSWPVLLEEAREHLGS